MMLLIHPPVAKPSEPPAGIARLSGMLKTHRVEHRVLDANIEGLLHLLRVPMPSEKIKDAWSRRAFRNIEQNISSIRNPDMYLNQDRYKRTVRDISRVLGKVSSKSSIVGLANYEHEEMSPLKSRDLLKAAEQPEMNSFYPYFQTRLEELFREKEPSVVGISLNYLSQALCSFAMIGFIKRELPGVKIILGGGLVTSWMKNPIWKNPFSCLVDNFVAGAGEYQLLSLLGITVAEEKLPMPDYTPLPTDKYLSPGFVLPYSASTGCYWNKCGFCPEKAEENPYVPIPEQQVVSDLRALGEKTHPKLIHLLDNSISPALLKALAADTPGIPWYGFSRVNELLANPDFCIALRRSGCLMLKLGIESGDQDVLDRLEKGINVETASVVLKNLKNAGIAAYVYLIFGTPAETETSARKTLEFTVQHSDSIDFLNLAIFNMPVCGKAISGIRTKEFYEGDLSLYTDFVHPHGWDRKSVRSFLENEFIKHPAVSEIIKNEPAVFTSNHAAFFVMGKSYHRK